MRFPRNVDFTKMKTMGYTYKEKDLWFVEVKEAIDTWGLPDQIETDGDTWLRFVWEGEEWFDPDGSLNCGKDRVITWTE